MKALRTTSQEDTLRSEMNRNTCFLERRKLLCCGLTGLFALSSWSLDSTIAQDDRQDDQNEAAGDERFIPRSDLEILEQLQDEYTRKWRDVRRRLAFTRGEVIHALLKLLHSDKPHLKRIEVDVVRLLGEYRAIEARVFLVHRIAAIRVADVFETHPLAEYPAAIALTQIGSPSFESIHSRLDGAVSERELKLFAYVIRYIEGNENIEVGLFRLQHWLQRENRDLRKQNLQRLVEIYKSDLSDSKNWP